MTHLDEWVDGFDTSPPHCRPRPHTTSTPFMCVCPWLSGIQQMLGPSSKMLTVWSHAQRIRGWESVEAAQAAARDTPARSGEPEAPGLHPQREEHDPWSCWGCRQTGTACIIQSGLLAAGILCAITTQQS